MYKIENDTSGIATKPKLFAFRGRISLNFSLLLAILNSTENRKNYVL